MRVTSVSDLAEVRRINPGLFFIPGLYDTRSSIEIHGQIVADFFPGITTEDRECAMRLIPFLVVFEEGSPFREEPGRPQRQTSGAGRGAR
jgi:hypothetical protein